MLSAIVIPAAASEFSIPGSTSVTSFSRPYDSRFQYGLPTGKSLNVFGRRHNPKDEESFTTSVDDEDDEDIVLDTKTVAPQKKIIKKLSADSQPNNSNVNYKDVPMNYDSFPKFYDPNDMSNQQFMPMMTY